MRCVFGRSALLSFVYDSESEKMETQSNRAIPWDSTALYLLPIRRRRDLRKPWSAFADPDRYG